MSRCVQITVDDPQNMTQIERGVGGGGGRVKCVGVPVCHQLSRRAAGCLRLRAKFSGSSGSRFSPLFTPWLPSAQTILTRQFSSSATIGMGENSPTTYTLQGSSLKTWVNFHPGRIPRQICIYFFFLSVCHKCAQSSASTKGGGGGGGGN